MTKEREKRIDKMPEDFRKRLTIVVDNIIENRLDWYDIKPLQWFDGYFRVRIWNIRIIFEKQASQNKIKKIDFRWDVYK